MKNLLRFFIISSSIIICLSNSINITITCEYTPNFNQSTNTTTFYCFTKNVSITEKETNVVKIIELQNSTTKSFSSSKVTLFSINSQIVKYFPQNIDKIFKNLQTLTIRNCELKEISQKDLKNFKNLKFLQLARNKIVKIEKNLFKFNPKLELIDLFKNQLKVIDADTFDDLKNLNTLFLVDNKCISKQALSNRNEVLKLIQEIKINCK
ncbi:hypothetical protein PVAND_014770 [Polypedilum vanderplanki]|uniref:Leucine rich repeat protein n=1 Tax=Polypedilum vanderplanki TaxID=319348 RepID=A0A9J6BB11_POLVA|nr:hypothetical protein PVAND_014770 [Polypedilum vanderplanki]